MRLRNIATLHWPSISEVFFCGFWVRRSSKWQKNTFVGQQGQPQCGSAPEADDSIMEPMTEDPDSNTLRWKIISPGPG
jgi:putative methionine-R-sulfoxide reductase with GAF domain